MKKLLLSQVSIAWLLLALILAGAITIVGLLVLDVPPQNAVLIESVDDEHSLASMPAALPNSNSTPTEALALASPTPATIAVYVSGAVSQPGVYILPAGSRVSDALEAAGGPVPDAELGQINLAVRLADEQHVAVPRQGEAASTQPAQLTAAPPQAGKSPQASPRPSSKVNINTATASELETLPGIGQVLAGRIVADRGKNGPFKSVDDLERVSGIGPTLMERLRNLVTTGP